jgi:cytoskeletal protein CcmA (bactofilin family)
MRTIRDKIEGPYAVSEDLALQGMIAGDATVMPKVTLVLKGTVTGNLTVEPGGRVELDGTVTGDVTNRGHAEVRGVIGGSLRDLDDGESNIGPNAVIQSRR